MRLFLCIHQIALELIGSIESYCASLSQTNFVHFSLFYSQTTIYLANQRQHLRCDQPQPMEFMTNENHQSTTQAEPNILRTILEGTSAETGTPFLRALVKNLSEALKTTCAWVSEYVQTEEKLRALAFWRDGEFVEGYQYALAGTVCQDAIRRRSLVHIPERLIDLYPLDHDLKPVGAVSYMGVPLLDDDEAVMGHLAVLNNREMPYRPELEWLFRIFAARAGAELRRLRLETSLRQREEQFRLLFDSMMDGLIQVDSQFRIYQINDAALRIFGTSAENLIGKPLTQILAEHSANHVTKLAEELANGKRTTSYLWIPEALEGITARATRFPAEASLSTCLMRGEVYFTLVLRNVREQVEAKRKISVLTGEKAYLQEELNAHFSSSGIIGDSPVMRKVLSEVAQVAPTDATVLILGQTGTGKEMIARAVHLASKRADQLLVTVNCAAIPANLVESELFGHERGAFTGATQERKGRFALADGGTIFLDEIGELALDVQSKLLRILQERSFEPVGSSKSQQVDVRVIAATNRDLAGEVAAGRFREDLYYRINVFPILLPPLHDRGEDVLALANAFAQSFAQRIGKPIRPLDSDTQRRLLAYEWPGNVRELQNVIERAVITSLDGNVRLADLQSTTRPIPAPSAEDGDRVLSADEFQALERTNILRALEKAGGKIAGPLGAAKMLGMKPSTLSSRIAALGIKR